MCVYVCSSPQLSKQTTWSRASVACILRQSPLEANACEALMIKRAARIGDPWSGHVSFPGGRMSKSDQSEVDTCIRETHEEVGLDLRDSAVFSYVNTLGDFEVRPYGAQGVVVSVHVFEVKNVGNRSGVPLASVPGSFNFTVQKSEVDTAFWVPLDWLSDESKHGFFEWKSGHSHSVGPLFKGYLRVLGLDCLRIPALKIHFPRSMDRKPQFDCLLWGMSLNVLEKLARVDLTGPSGPRYPNSMVFSYLDRTLETVEKLVNRSLSDLGIGTSCPLHVVHDRTRTTVKIFNRFRWFVMISVALNAIASIAVLSQLKINYWVAKSRM